MSAPVLTFSQSRAARPPRHLADLDPAARRNAVADLGQPAYRADQLSRHYFGRLTADPAAMTDLPAAARDVLVPSLLCAAGIGCSFVPATIAATSSVRAEDSGLASGLLNTAYQVGSSLGVALLAVIAASQDGFPHAFAAGSGLALAGSAVALVVVREPMAVRHRSRLGAGARVELGEDA
jgi:hypothetical protein